MNTTRNSFNNYYNTASTSIFEISGSRSRYGINLAFQNPIARLIFSFADLAFSKTCDRTASHVSAPKVKITEKTADISCDFTIRVVTQEEQERSVSVAYSQGPRTSMEDEHIIDKIILKNEKIVHLFAVMDGHGGTSVATYLKDHLKTFIKAAAEEIVVSPDKEPKKIIKAQLELLNQEIKNKGLGRETGSTAVIAFVIENELYVANVGDSRAVLSHNGISVPLSDDAKPGVYTFDKTVNRLGGTLKEFIVRTRKGKKSIWRLDAPTGNLGVSRVFGDFAFRGVCATPKIETFNLNDLAKNPQRDFLILACDGIWDVLSNQEAVDSVKNELEAGGSPETAAAKLIATAYEKKSSDNCSAMIIPFKK